MDNNKCMDLDKLKRALYLLDRYHMFRLSVPYHDVRMIYGIIKDYIDVNEKPLYKYQSHHKDEPLAVDKS